MLRQYFKGILWPRKPATEQHKVNYRYVIVGMLVTDRPLDLGGANEIVLDGQLFGDPDSQGINHPSRKTIR